MPNNKSSKLDDNYLLLKKRIHFKCNDIDERFKRLSNLNISEVDLYKVNNAENITNNDNLPKFNLNETNELSIFYRHFIPIHE